MTTKYDHVMHVYLSQEVRYSLVAYSFTFEFGLGAEARYRCIQQQ
jgi:hypothetical protein